MCAQSESESHENISCGSFHPEEKTIHQKEKYDILKKLNGACFWDHYIYLLGGKNSTFSPKIHITFRLLNFFIIIIIRVSIIIDYFHDN